MFQNKNRKKKEIEIKIKINDLYNKNKKVHLIDIRYLERLFLLKYLFYFKIQGCLWIPFSSNLLLGSLMSNLSIKSLHASVTYTLFIWTTFNKKIKHLYLKSVKPL